MFSPYTTDCAGWRTIHRQVPYYIPLREPNKMNKQAKAMWKREINYSLR